MIKATSSVFVVNINDGVDAEQQYNWIVYANSDTPSPQEISSDPAGKTHVGFAYNKKTETPSTNYRDYQWMNLDGHTIVSVKRIYYSTTEVLKENIPMPFSQDMASLYVRDGFVYTRDGLLDFFSENAKHEWGYERPEFVYGKHLWVSTEIITSDGKKIYSEPELSADWEIYYSLRIGGRNLIRNSKTLIDERIYWKS